MVLGIYGASGLGTEFHQLADKINREHGKWESIVYVDDDEAKTGSVLKGSPVMTFRQALEKYGKEGIEFILAIGEPNVKDKVFAKLEENGCEVTCLIHPDYDESLTDDIEIGKGFVMHGQSGFPPYSKFGNNVLIQGKAVMGHNLVAGDNVVISSLSFVGGDVTIGRNTYIAPGSCIRNGVRIGENAIVGMGAVVTKDVPDDAVVVGNPAKILRYNEKGRVFSK